MNNKRQFKIILLSALTLGSLSAHALPVKGSADLGVRNVSGHDNSAKFKEYRDFNTVFGSANVLYEKEDTGYFTEFTGENIASSEQSYDLTGGKLGSFKYGISYDEITHNTTFGASSVFNNPGSAELTVDANMKPATGSGTGWLATPGVFTGYDYKVEHKKTEAMMSMNFGENLFGELSASRKTTKGLRAMGIETRSAGATQFAEPMDYVTDDIGLTAGFRGENFLVTLEGALVKFNDKNDSLGLENFRTDVTVKERVSLPPDNKEIEGTLKATYFGLPLNSAVNVSMGRSVLTNEISPWMSVESAATTYRDIVITSADQMYKGKIVHTDLAFSATSEPIDGLNAKAYYKYSHKKNESNEMDFAFKGTGPGVQTDRFSYGKNTAGVDLGYSKLPLSTKLDVGAQIEDVTRSERSDSGGNKDKLYYAQIKNNFFESVTPKIKYEYLKRTGDNSLGNAGTGTGDSLYLFRSFRRFDVASQNRHVGSVGVDYSPIEALDVGLEAKYKTSEYPESLLGVSGTSSKEFAVDVTYTHALATVSLFGDYEKSSHKTKRIVASTNFDPTVPTNGTNYDFSTITKDTTTTYGANVTVPVIKDTLVVDLGVSREKSDGAYEFTTDVGSFTDIQNWGDYTKTQATADVKYTYNKDYDATLGYMYEKLQYSDISVDGEEGMRKGCYASATVTCATIWPGDGYMTDSNYNVNVIYGKVTARF